MSIIVVSSSEHAALPEIAMDHRAINTAFIGD
jgi:hypothetical protein